MTKTNHPNGANYVSPYLTVLDVQRSADFYHQAFKFTISQLCPSEEGAILHGELKYEDQLIMIGKQGAYGGETLAPVTSKVKSPMNLYIYCKDVDAFYQEALTAGATSVSAPENTFWGDRMCSLECPNGYVWCFATHLGT